MAKKAVKKASKELNFEAALGELESLVEQLEQGDISLEESLSHFERGVQLTRTCQQALQEAEQKVEILMQKNGEEHFEDFADAGQKSE